MEFKVRRKPNPNIQQYKDEDLDIAYRFAKEIYTEFELFVKAVVLFGATARRAASKEGDIDILVIIDDISTYLSAELVEAYRIITQKIIGRLSKRLHITTLRFSSFWEYIRSGDPVAVNILRDGVALVDTGFFDPLRTLLKQGRIRPTPEAVWTYYSRAPATLFNSRWHLLQATLDLYWGVIDASHAALMHHGEIPPSPNHVADLIEEALVKKGIVEKKYANMMRDFYILSKKIVHREIKDISGAQYEVYYRMAEEYVERMRRIIEKR